jgi:hypothetical protein
MPPGGVMAAAAWARARPAAPRPEVCYPCHETPIASSIVRCSSISPAVDQRSPGDAFRADGLLAPDLANPWSYSIAGISPLPNPAADARLLPFLPKKPDGVKPPMLSVNETQDIGPQYPLLRNGGTTFLASLGGGYCQGYPALTDGRGLPEVLLGCQLEEQVNCRNKLLGLVEYASDPVDIGYRRLRAKAAWEVFLDPARRLSLHTSVLEAANYAPNGDQAKNVTYAFDLGWQF